MMRPRPSHAVNRSFRRPTVRPRLERLEERCVLSAGDLDLTFGNGGVANVAGMDFRAVTIQPGDGKIVAAGSVSVPAGNRSDYVVARFNTDGSLDDGGPNDLTPGDAFGVGGFVQLATRFGAGPWRERIDVAVRPDGVIVLAGTAFDFLQVRTSSILALIRGTDGTLVRRVDTTYVSLSSNTSMPQWYHAVNIQEDNTILVAGVGKLTSTGPWGFFVRRFDPDGLNPETSALVEFVPGARPATAEMALQPGGKVVVAGPTDGEGSPRLGLARFNNDLTLDTGFGVGGKVVQDVTSSNDVPLATAVDGDGRILVAGSSALGPNGSHHTLLARFTPNGSGLDTSFNNGQGYVTTPIITDPNLPSSDFYDLAVQANGKIVTVAQASSNFGPTFILARFGADGVLDPTFGTGGIVMNSLGAAAFGVAIQPGDGNVVAVGNHVVARYIGDPVRVNQAIAFDPLPDATYGAEPFSLSATASSGLTVSFNVVSGPATLAGNTLTITGTGTVVVRASQDGNEAYNPAEPVERSFVIAPAPLTVTVDDATRVYGDPNPFFTVQYSGFVYSEGASVLGGAVVFDTLADPTSLVGEYPVTASGLTAANYDLLFVAGTLTVTPAPLTITAHDASRVYGTPNPAFTGTLTGLKNGDAIGAAFSTPATVASPAAAYLIVPAVLDADPPRLGNYTVTLVPATLTVARAAQTITWASPAPILHGTALGAEQLSATVSVPGPDPAAGVLSYDTPAGTVLPVGVHTLRVTAAETPNYNAATASVPLRVLAPASVSGMVFIDANDNGEVDLGENGIAGVTITLSGTDDLGRVVSHAQPTDGNGAYLFLHLRPGSYSITETQPAGYTQGINLLGTLGGTVAGDQFFIELAEGANGLNYNFGERTAAGVPVSQGQTAGVGFWNNRNGQALIKSLNGGANATQLGNWLAATFANTYGANAGANDLTGKTNARVATFFQEKFRVRGPKLDAQVLATALSVYVTNRTLAGDVALAYGFQVTEFGLGTATYNVGSSGAAFGVADGTTLTVVELLLATNRLSTDGVLYYDPDPARMRYLRELAHTVFSGLNQEGDIG